MADDWIDVRIRLRGARQAQVEAVAVAGGIRSIGDAADRTSLGLERTSRRSNLFQATLWGVRRATQALGLSMFALGGGAGGAGFSFNSSMEANTISLGHFLGSTGAAENQLERLFELSKRTPFSFEGITTATTQMLAYGFSLQQTNSLLETIADTAAGLPAGEAAIPSIVRAFGQIRSTGRLSFEELNQLADVGVPALQILRKELGLTDRQIRQLRTGGANLSSETAIAALERGLSTQYRGLAAIQAQSERGLRATALDTVRQFLGVATRPAFERWKGLLKSTIPILENAGEAFKRGGWEAMFLTIDRGVGANGRLVTGWHQVRDAGTAVARIATEVLIPTFLVLWGVLGVGSPVMGVLVDLLGFAADHTTVLKIALGLYIAKVILSTAANIAWAFSTRLVGTNLFVLTGTTTGATSATKLFTLWTLRAELAQMAASRASLLWLGRLKGVRAALVALRLLGPIAIPITLLVIYKKEARGFLEWINRLPSPRLGDRIPGVKSALGEGSIFFRDGRGQGGLPVARPAVAPLAAGPPVDFGGALRLPPIRAAAVKLNGRDVGEVVFEWEEGLGARD